MQIGVDLGGTKIEAAALSNGGEVLARQRIATPKRNYKATVEQITLLVQQLETSLGERGRSKS